jgi:hypothetical protein
MWSQFRAVDARPGVWRLVAHLAALSPEHQIPDLVLWTRKEVGTNRPCGMSGGALQHARLDVGETHFPD